jgi:hypothetical protein
MHGTSGYFGTLRFCAGVVLKRLGNVEEKKQTDPIFSIQTDDSSFVTVYYAWTLTQLAIVCNMHTCGTQSNTALIRLNPAHAMPPSVSAASAQHNGHGARAATVTLFKHQPLPAPTCIAEWAKRPAAAA